MNHLIRALGALSVVTAGWLVACGGSHQEPAVYGSGVTSAQKTDLSVVDKVAAARCDREQKCNNVGGGQKYASRDVCMEQLRGSLANDLNAYDCPRGIDAPQLDQCMTAIRGEECGHPFDSLSRMEKCRSGALCMK